MRINHITAQLMKTNENYFVFCSERFVEGRFRNSQEKIEDEMQTREPPFYSFYLLPWGNKTEMKMIWRCYSYAVWLPDYDLFVYDWHVWMLL